MVSFFKKKNQAGVTTTRPVTTGNGQSYKEPPMEPFVQNKQHPIIKTKDGDTVELLGGGKMIVNGKRMNLEQLKQENPSLHTKVLKIASRMGTAAAWLGKGKGDLQN